VELARDKFLECCYTGLRISDANRAAWKHVHGQMLVLDDTAKNTATVYIPFYDDDLFQPVALCERYEHRSPLDLLVPECYQANEFLVVVQQLAGLARLSLLLRLGARPSLRSSSTKACRPGSSCRLPATKPRRPSTTTWAWTSCDCWRNLCANRPGAGWLSRLKVVYQ
jgi:hypothetical protein